MTLKFLICATWGIVVSFTELGKAGHGAGLWVVLWVGT